MSATLIALLLGVVAAVDALFAYFHAPILLASGS